MKKIIKLTENQLNKIVKRVLSESYEGIIKQGDTSCDIKCKRKIAKNGSSGDVVKMIQHYLAKGSSKNVTSGGNYGPYNSENSGGGMTEACAQSWEDCDGKFRSETKKAVEEFQEDVDSLTKDGVVGAETLKMICQLLGDQQQPYKSLCSDCNCDDKQSQKDNPPLSGNPGRRRTTPVKPPGKFVEDGNWWDVITEPLEDIWDWIITPAPGDGNSEGKNCDKVNDCVKFAMGEDSENWKFFLACIGKTIKNPIQKDDPTLKEGCEGCPQWTNRMPGVGQTPMSPFIQSCVDNKCTKMAF